MRRYLSNPFGSAFVSDTAPTATTPIPTPTSTVTDGATNGTAKQIDREKEITDGEGYDSDNETSQPPTSPTQQQQQQQQQQKIAEQPSPTTGNKSYVPSLPIAIPSMRKYLFPASSPTNNSPPQQESNHHHHHHHLHLPNLRRRHSASSSDHILGGPSTSVDTCTSTTTSTKSTSSLNELCQLVDNTIGPIGNLPETLAKRLPHDKLLMALNKSVQDRNRILCQFLRARHQNATEAMLMISTSLRWRKTVDIETYLKKSIQNMGSPDACFPMTLISTPEQCKQPVVYGLIRLLDKRKAERIPFQNALLSFLESSYFGDTYVLDEMIIILDFRDWSIRRNAPYRLVKDGLQTLQNYYPERLGRVFLVNYPATIRAAFTAISPIIDAGAKEKIIWIGEADPSATLLKYLPPKSIPSFLGGELKSNFPPGWPDIKTEFEKAKASSSHGGFVSSLMH